MTTLRHLPGEVQSLEEQDFKAYYRTPNQKCWLIRTDKPASPALGAYLEAVREVDYQTSTCLAREEWWKFSMPSIPDVLMSTSFKGKFPKAVRNSVGACAVGGVSGIYNLSSLQTEKLIADLDRLDIEIASSPTQMGCKKSRLVNLMHCLPTSSTYKGVPRDDSPNRFIRSSRG